MKLSERMKEAEREGALHSWTASTPRTAGLTSDAMGGYKENLHTALFARVGERLFDSSVGVDEMNRYIAQEINDMMAAAPLPLTATERATLAAEMLNDIVGLGPVEQFLSDPSITEIMVNSLDFIYIERHGLIEQTAVRFFTEEHLRRVIERVVGKVGRRIDESSPMVDARLPDGSRVNAIIPPLAVDGPVLTIRKFSKDPLQVDDLIGYGTITADLAEFLKAVVEVGLNVLVTGGTGTGKTTFLNVLSGFIPSDERIVTIEDSLELQLHQEHVIRLESRPPNIEGRGEVTVRDLVRNALRMRPDRIIVGEVRGNEALDMLQAMNTGHDGSIATVHCSGPRDALSRIETLVLMSGVELPSRSIREQMASAIDCVVHLRRFRDGSRRITQVSEVVGMEGDTITMNDIYVFDHSAGRGPEGQVLGVIKPTGVRPAFTDRFIEANLNLPAGVYGGVSVKPGDGWGR